MKGTVKLFSKILSGCASSYKETMENYVGGAEQSDDITMLGLAYKG